MNVEDLVATVDRTSFDGEETVWFQDDDGVLHVVASVERDAEGRILLVGETG